MRICVNKDSVWEYVKQPPLNEKILVLTKDNQTLVSVWKGEPLGSNKTFKAWLGLPDRLKDLERQMGYL